MSADETGVTDIAVRWLTGFEAALSAPTPAALEDMFAPDCYWRDVLALTWDLETVHKPRPVAERVWRENRVAAVSSVALDGAAPPPGRVDRVGRDHVER